VSKHGNGFPFGRRHNRADSSRYIYSKGVGWSVALLAYGYGLNCYRRQFVFIGELVLDGKAYL
jgi:hypothetical protein